MQQAGARRRRFRDEGKALPVPPEFEDGPATAAAGPSGETAVPPLALMSPLAGLPGIGTMPALGGVPPMWMAMPWLWPAAWWLQTASLMTEAWARTPTSAKGASTSPRG